MFYLDKYTYKEFLKIPFLKRTSSQIFFKDFDHSYYDSSFKYAAHKIFFSIASVKLSTKNEAALKDFFSKFEAINKSQILIYS